MTLHFEDLVPGRKFESGLSEPLTAEAIIAFARDYDPQPFHLDAEAARDSLFGGLVASGWHVAAITMRLMVSDALPLAGGMIGAGGEIAWPRPTRPGDRLRVIVEVLDARASRSRADRGSVTIRTETLNQDGETVQVMTSRTVVRRAEGDRSAEVERT